MKFKVRHQPVIPEKLKNSLTVAKILHDEFDQDNTMYCPHCGRPLVKTDRMEPLMTIDEEISGTNNISNKPVYKCITEDCPGQYLMWNGYGDAYTDINIEDKTAYKLAYNMSHNQFGEWTSDAINSLSFKINNESQLKKEIHFNIFKVFGFIPVITHQYELDGFGKVISVRYKLDYWIKTDNGGYYIKPSLWRRLKYKCWKFRKMI